MFLGRSGDCLKCLPTTGDNVYHVVHNMNVNQTAVLDGFIIKDGFASLTGPSNSGFPNNIGAGVYNENASPSFKQCIFKNNLAYLEGGGVYSIGGDMTFENCLWKENVASMGGGFYSIKGKITLVYGDFENNYAIENGASGGGVFLDSTEINLLHCQFSNNEALINGAAIFAKNNSRIMIDSSNFDHNTSETIHGEFSTMNMQHSTVTEQHVKINGQELVFENCYFGNNAYLDVTATDTCRIFQCQFNQAGIKSNSNVLFIDSCHIIQAPSNGVYISGGIAEMAHSTIAQCNGSGLYVETNATVSDCIITKNMSSQGGGIFIESNLPPIIQRCIIDSNIAINGAGLFISYSSGAGASLENCIISNNIASNVGGAMYADFQTASSFKNCTIVGNSAVNGGDGFYFYTALNHILNLSNSIVWNHNQPIKTNDSINTTLNIDHSIINGTTIYSGLGNSNLDPLFKNVNNLIGNDGIWHTSDDGLSLQSCSPAIDAGSSIQAPVTDITGYSRTNAIDMGAYEFQGVGLSIPTQPGLFRANRIIHLGNRLHYIDCNNNYLLLTLDTVGSGAIIPADSVTVQVGVGATFYPSGTGFVQNIPGEVFFNRMWDVRPLQQPLHGKVDVYMYYTTADFNAVKDTALQNGMYLNVETEMDFYKVKTSGLAPFPSVSSLQTSDVIRIEHGSMPDTNLWVEGNFSGNKFAHFQVSSFSGGGGGIMHTVFPLSVSKISLSGRSHNGWANLTYEIVQSGILNELALEQSHDGLDFKQVENLLPTWNTHQQQYSTTQKLPFESTYYRLRARSEFGDVVYSPIILVKDQEESQFSIYPNPTKEVVCIESYSDKKFTVIIQDMQGNILREAEYSSNKQMVGLNGLASGLYILQIKQAGNMNQYKLQIE